MPPRTALVTGVTGLVGSHVAERLLRDGWAVRGLVRAPDRAGDVAAMGVELLRGDVLDDASFATAARGCDAIFHAAAEITPKGGWEVFRRTNVDGTANAVAAAERAGARLVQVSSVAVYGEQARYGDGSEKTNEDMVPAASARSATASHYARSKRESEALVMRAHAAGRIWATAVRPCVVYGPRDRQCVPRAARLLLRGYAPLVGGGRSVMPIVHAANVADGAVRAATSDVAGGRAYNLTNDFPVTVREFFSLGGQGLGRTVRFVPVPKLVAAATYGIISRIVAAITGRTIPGGSIDFITRDNPFTSARAYQELGWSPPVRPERGVPDAFRWWLEHERRRGE